MCADPNSPSTATEPSLAEENRRLREIADALMRRVEREQAKMGDGAYGYFQVAMALEQRVRQRTNALEAALERLETSNVELRAAKESADRASRAKSDFLATMSHEIRTPMHGVVGAIELLTRTRLDDEQQALVRTLRGACDSMLRLIDDILDIARLERQRVQLELASVDLREFLGGLTSLFAPRAMSKGLSFACEMGDDLPDRIEADAHRLRQVLSNLLSNAIKFTSHGGVRIEVTREVGPTAGSGLRIAIADTGIGVPDDQSEAIFEAFRQADSSTTRVYGGTGLGLAIAHRLADAMGGALSLEASSEAGSTFALWIPLNDDAGPAPIPRSEERARPCAPRHCGQRFLIVDDSDLNRDVLRRMLRGKADVIDEVANGEEALAACRDHRYDFVFMDWRMPRMDGLDATRRIRSFGDEAATPADVPIVGLTANVHATDLAACLEAGMTSVLPKPFLIDDLHARVAQVLRASKARGA